jgi:hypothetical protein
LRKCRLEASDSQNLAGHRRWSKCPERVEFDYLQMAKDGVGCVEKRLELNEERGLGGERSVD